MRPKHERGKYDVYHAPARSYRNSSTRIAPNKSVDGIKQHLKVASAKPPSSLRPPVNNRYIHQVKAGVAPTATKPADPVHRARLAKKSSVRSSKVQWKPALLMVMAASLFVIGGVVSYASWRTNKHVAAWVHDRSGDTGSPAGESAADEEVPDENEPTGSLGSYYVAPDLPRLLRIGELKVSARIKPLGVNNKNQLRSPSNIHDVGWYEASAKPGLGGTTLVDGHVHGPTRPGVFYNLKKLEPGSRIEIERGDGATISYQVIKTEKYRADNVDMAAAMTSAVPGKEALNLITCTGALDKRNNTYEDRLVVFAVRAD